jgi:hypothetical protein
VRDEKNFNDWMSDDKISDFDDFCSKVCNFVKDSSGIEWLVIRRYDCLCICAVDVSEVPRFTVAVKVRQDMTVDVFKGDCQISGETLQWVLGAERKLTCWSQLSSVLSHFAMCAKGMHVSIEDQVKLVDKALNELIDMTHENDEYDPSVTARLRFVREQIRSAYPRSF